MTEHAAIDNKPVYDVRYKGHVERQGLGEHELVELVRSGQVSGVHAYAQVGTDRWLPVFRMEYQRNDEGRWTIVDAVLPTKPTTPESTIPLAPSGPGAGPPQITNPSVVIYQQTPPPAPLPVTPPAGLDVHHSVGGGLSITGFIVGVIAFVAGALIAIPALARPETAIAGAVLATAAIVFSACGMSSRRRRGLGIAGLVLGIVAIVGWAVVIVVMMIELK